MYIGGVLSAHCLFCCLRYHARWIPEAVVFGEVTSVLDCYSPLGDSGIST